MAKNSAPVSIMLNGRLYGYQNSTRNYTHAWLYTDENGCWTVLSFHTSVANAMAKRHSVTHAPGEINSIYSIHGRRCALVEVNTEITTRPDSKRLYMRPMANPANAWTDEFARYDELRHEMLSAYTNGRADALAGRSSKPPRWSMRLMGRDGNASKATNRGNYLRGYEDGQRLLAEREQYA
jgi:hypothetical protein